MSWRCDFLPVAPPCKAEASLVDSKFCRCRPSENLTVTVADRGYFKIEDIEACEKAGWSRMCRAPNEVRLSHRPLQSN